MESIKKELAAVKEKLVATRAQLSTKEKEAAASEAELTSQEKELESLKSTLATRDNEVTLLKKTLAAKEEALKSIAPADEATGPEQMQEQAAGHKKPTAPTADTSASTSARKRSGAKTPTTQQQRPSFAFHSRWPPCSGKDELINSSMFIVYVVPHPSHPWTIS
jgi:hypothetical protein